MEKTMKKHRLDLLVRLLDEDTGEAVTEKNITFLRKGEDFSMVDKGCGNFIRINTNRENGKLNILAYGYEHKEVVVDYQQLDERLPMIQVKLKRRRLWD